MSHPSLLPCSPDVYVCQFDITADPADREELRRETDRARDRWHTGYRSQSIGQACLTPLQILRILVGPSQ